VEAMAIVYSHPPWLVAKWLQQFGTAATEKLLLANNRHPPPPPGALSGTHAHGMIEPATRGGDVVCIAFQVWAFCFVGRRVGKWL